MSAFLNLMATSRFMDDPRRLLIQRLIDTDPPMMRITAKQVLDFVSNIDNPSTALLEELRSLRESPAIHEPVIHAVRWIWFATQHCHLFGEQSFVLR
jgi:hypothetical protein